jgi:hypothetical protein|tara:strand:+ start:43561 stop:43806 length:246 start_codon:yes stop_codon:yes gene_type:complete
MAIRGKIRQTNQMKGKKTGQNEIVAQTVKISANGLNLGDLGNVNANAQTDGAIMIYDGTAGEYKITTQVENQNLNIIGGTY